MKRTDLWSWWSQNKSSIPKYLDFSFAVDIKRKLQRVQNTNKLRSKVPCSLAIWCENSPINFFWIKSGQFAIWYDVTMLKKPWQCGVHHIHGSFIQFLVSAQIHDPISHVTKEQISKYTAACLSRIIKWTNRNFNPVGLREGNSMAIRLYLI